MRCTHAHKLILRALDGDLRPRDERALGDHLASCPGCASHHRDLLAAQEALLSFRGEPVRAPRGLDARIKTAAQDAYAEAQIRETAAARQIGSPAFVATCASLVVASVMVYAVTTQVYMKGLDARAEDARRPAETRLALAAPSSTAPLTRAVTPSPGSRSPLRRASRQAPVDRALQRPPTWVYAASQAPSPSPARPAAPRPSAPAGPRNAATELARPGPASALPAPEPGPAPGPAEAEPELRTASVSQPETPAHHTEAPAPMALEATEEPPQRDFVAGLIADCVVEKYVVSRLATADLGRGTATAAPAVLRTVVDEAGN